MNIFNKNKNFLKAIALAILFTSSLNAFDFKFITASFSKNVAKKTAIAGQSVCAANILSGSQAKFFNIKSLLGKLSSFATSKPKTFIALSAAALLSVIGFVWRKFFFKKFIEKCFVCAYKGLLSLELTLHLLDCIDLDRAKELIGKHGRVSWRMPYSHHPDIILKMVRLMLYSGSDVNKADEDGDTPLCLACNLCYLGDVSELPENVEIVRELLKHENIDVNKANKNGATPLLLACDLGYSGIVRELLKHENIDVNKADKDGRTPLGLACRNHRELEIVKLLLENGAIVDETLIKKVWRQYMRIHGFYELKGIEKEIFDCLNLAKNFDSCKQSGSFFDFPEAEKNNKDLCDFADRLATRRHIKNKTRFPNSFNSERAMAKFGNCRIKTLT